MTIMPSMANKQTVKHVQKKFDSSPPLFSTFQQIYSDYLTIPAYKYFEQQSNTQENPHHLEEIQQAPY